MLMPRRDLVDAHLLTEVLLEATPRGRSCSAGLTERPPGTDPAAAMIRPSRALYEAKANGRAQVRVAADPNTPDGLAALPTIVYQPIVTAAALVVVGYEALSRFADHRPPDTVFRVAHANGSATCWKPRLCWPPSTNRGAHTGWSCMSTPRRRR